MKMEDMNNPLLDDLFAEARVEAPQHSYQATKKALLSGLAIGGAGLLTAKIITSSILKSKFFIMSISAVTILSSAVLVYTTALKPNEAVSDHVMDTQTELVATNTPMGNVLPEDLFVEAIIADFEPDDSTITIEPDSSTNVEEVIEEATKQLEISMEKIEDILSEVESQLKNIEIEVENGEMIRLEEFLANVGEVTEEMGHDLEEHIEQIVEDIEHIQIQNREGEMVDLDDYIEDMADESELREDILEMVADVEEAVANIIEDVHVRQHNHVQAIGVHDSEELELLTRKVFTVTEKTTGEDIEAFHKTAIAAGMDMRYDCKVNSNRIKNLNIRLTIDNQNGRNHTSDLHISNVKRNENFAHNIIWYENEAGQAVRFNKRTSTCRSRTTHCR